MIDWSQYKNFSKEEFDCSHTGRNKMRPEFMEVLQQARAIYGRPMIISSGYRDYSHPVERIKQSAGEHTYGLAADILVRGVDAMDLQAVLYGLGIRRIGLKQKGDGRFMHVGMGDMYLNFPQSIWTY